VGKETSAPKINQAVIGGALVRWKPSAPDVAAYQPLAMMLI